MNQVGWLRADVALVAAVLLLAAHAALPGTPETVFQVSAWADDADLDAAVLGQAVQVSHPDADKGKIKMTVSLYDQKAYERVDVDKLALPLWLDEVEILVQPVKAKSPESKDSKSYYDVEIMAKSLAIPAMGIQHPRDVLQKVGFHDHCLYIDQLLGAAGAFNEECTHDDSIFYYSASLPEDEEQVQEFFKYMESRSVLNAFAHTGTHSIKTLRGYELYPPDYARYVDSKGRISLFKSAQSLNEEVKVYMRWITDSPLTIFGFGAKKKNVLKDFLNFQLAEKFEKSITLSQLKPKSLYFQIFKDTTRYTPQIIFIGSLTAPSTFKVHTNDLKTLGVISKDQSEVAIFDKTGTKFTESFLRYPAFFEGDKLCNVAITRKLQASGYHRIIATSIKLDKDFWSCVKPLLEQHPGCKVDLAVMETLPRGVYVDPYQLEQIQQLPDLKYQNLSFQIINDVDVEKSAKEGKQNVVLAYKKGISTFDEHWLNFTLPVHYRYQFARSTEKFVEVTIPPPDVYFKVQCEVEKAKECPHSQSSVFIDFDVPLQVPVGCWYWQKTDFATLADLLIAKIPVGQQSHNSVVLIGTIASILGGLIFITCFSTQSRNTKKKESKKEDTPKNSAQKEVKDSKPESKKKSESAKKAD